MASRLVGQMTSRGNAIRESWHPQSQKDRDAVRSELHEILASPHFCNSKRYPALLQYIVESTLAGRAELLKERTLGVEVFERPPSYDTNTDTVVRYTASEVRKRLLLHYHQRENHTGVKISLPAGSYIPEFEDWRDVAEAVEDVHDVRVLPLPVPVQEMHAEVPAQRKMSRLAWCGVAAVALVAMILGWRSMALHPQTALDEFWSPVLRDQKKALICTGGSSFAQNNFSGVVTAGKDVDYPFVSIQIASSISQLSSLMQRIGATPELQASASTPLTELREQPLILLGGYNNQWTLRLVQPLRFHFTPEAEASIVDQMQADAQPRQRWERDHSLSYANAGDFAIVARYRDATTGSWVIVLAGLGRNGTEAAAQFVTSPRYMQMLHDRIGGDFGSRNVEAVLKVNVVDGKTGAPAILATQVW